MINRRDFIKGITASLLAASTNSYSYAAKNDRPNILWITCEDIGPFLGCYGDENANTPNIDILASNGVRYLNAYSNAPVCAPARNTIATGTLACSLGTSNMRSRRPIPDFVKSHAAYLKELGYYTTNRSKTDYNTSTIKASVVWDECSKKASYQNRKLKDQPFFAIFNYTHSHESKLHKVSNDPKSFTVDPSSIALPPFLPDTPEIRNTLAKEHDLVSSVDKEVGKLIEELEISGQADNTIIFFYGDHGGAYPRTKRYLYRSGTVVPMIVKFPPKYEHLLPAAKGSAIDRLVCFADLTPTLLSLVGIKPPKHMQGKPFLGKFDSGEHKYILNFGDRFDERYRMTRMICDKDFLYIRNFTPNRTRGEYLHYYYLAPAVKSWYKDYIAGRCNETQSRVFNPSKPEELYELKKDPWQINNLAKDQSYSRKLKRMRSAMIDYMKSIKDAGVLPEAYMVEISKGRAPYSMIREDKIDHDQILKVALLASENDTGNISKLTSLLSSHEPAIRYWAAMGLSFLGKDATGPKSELKKAAGDPIPNVRYAAIEALLNIGDDPSGNIDSLLNDVEMFVEKEYNDVNLYKCLYAINVLTVHFDKCKPFKNRIIKLYKSLESKKSLNYIVRNTQYLLYKIDNPAYPNFS